MSIVKTIKTVFFAALLACAATSMSQVPANGPISSEDKAGVLADMSKIITQRAYVPGVDFNKWSDLVKKHRPEIDKAKDHIQFTQVMNKALDEFGFSHIVLFSPQMADMRANRKMVGLGVRIQQEDRGMRIVLVFPGTPADEVGLRPGDLIIKGDGKPVKAPPDLAGEPGSKVKVTIERDGKEKTIEVTRRTFSTDVPETLTWVNDKTAMLSIPTFDLGYKSYRVAELMKEIMPKAEQLILDLRSNGGGRVDNLLSLCGYFMDTTTPIGTFVNKPMADDYAKDTGKPAMDAVAVASWIKNPADRLRPSLARRERFQGKVAVLVNGGTGSASEMMALALKENMGAKLIGSKTAGAVLASQMQPISKNYLLQYPLMDYVSIKGYRIEGHGLKVDAEAPIAKFGEEDKAVTIALKLLSDGN